MDQTPDAAPAAPPAPTSGPWRVSPLRSDAIVSDLPIPGFSYARHAIGPFSGETHEEGMASHHAYYGGFCVAESVAPGDRPLITAVHELREVTRECDDLCRLIIKEAVFADRPVIAGVVTYLGDLASAALAKAEGKVPA